MKPPIDYEIQEITRKQLLRDVEAQLKNRLKMNGTHILLKQMRTYLLQGN